MAIVYRRVEAAEEIEAVSRLRYEISVRELGKAVSAADHVRGTLWDSLDDQSAVLGAFDGGSLVGTVRLTSASRLPNSAGVRRLYDLDRFSPQYADQQLSVTSRLMVRPEYRGTPVATQILTLAYEIGRSEGTVFNFMHTTAGLIPIYEVMGFRRYLKGRIDPEVGYRIPMILVADDLDHLDRVRSPFRQSSRKFPSDAGNAEWFREEFPEWRHPSTLRNAPVHYGEQIVEELHRSAVMLTGIGLEGIKALTRNGVLHYPAGGDCIIREGDRWNDLIFVLSGDVAITGSVVGKIGTHGCIGPGVRSNPVVSSYSAYAQSGCVLLSLGLESIERLEKTNPHVAATLRANGALVSSHFGGR